MYKLDLEKAEKPEIKLPTSTDQRKSKGIPEKHVFIDYAKAFDCGSQQTEKFWRRWEYQTTLPVSWETCMEVKKR